MIKVSHTTMIAISGLLWLMIGSFLLLLGVNFIVDSILKENLTLYSRPFLDWLATFTDGRETAALVIIGLSLIIGYTKGRLIFAKTVQSGVKRILTLPDPAPLSQIYTKKYYILLGSMVLIGFIMRFASFDIRGAVDVAIGSALIQGAILYFANAYRNYRGFTVIAG